MASKTPYKPKHQTKCWECEWAGGKDGKCPWATRFEPVPGWKAKPTKILIASKTQTPDGKPQYTDSFDVYECPLFELMTEIRLQREATVRKMLMFKDDIQNKDKALAIVERLWLVEHKNFEQIAAATGLPYYKVIYLIRKIKERLKNER